MSRRRKTEIISIFGQIEMIVAEQMMAEGKGIGKLAPTLNVTFDDLPPSTRYNELGQAVRMVIIVPTHLMREFEERVSLLRA
jgi:hypothetical protein